MLGGNPGAQIPQEIPLLSPENGPVWATLVCGLLKAAHGKQSLSAHEVMDLRAQYLEPSVNYSPCFPGSKRHFLPDATQDSQNVMYIQITQEAY